MSGWVGEDQGEEEGEDIIGCEEATRGKGNDLETRLWSGRRGRFLNKNSKTYQKGRSNYGEDQKVHTNKKLLHGVGNLCGLAKGKGD